MSDELRRALELICRKANPPYIPGEETPLSLAELGAEGLGLGGVYLQGAYLRGLQLGEEEVGELKRLHGADLRGNRRLAAKISNKEWPEGALRRPPFPPARPWVPSSGHVGTIWSLVVLGEGWLVSGSEDNSVKMWRKQEGQWRCTQTLEGHKGGVRSLAVLEDGWLASGSDDKTIKLWREQEGQWRCMQTLVDHRGAIRSLAVVKEGLLASGSQDRTVKLWREHEGEWSCIQTLVDHKGPVWSLAMLEEGLLASGSDDKTVKLWQEQGKQWICVQTLQGHKDWVRSMAVPRESWLASGSDDKTVKLWLKQGELWSCMQTLESHGGWIRSLAVLGEGWLASGSQDRTVKLWREQGGQWSCTQTLAAGVSGGVASLVHLPNRCLAAGGSSGITLFAPDFTPEARLYQEGEVLVTLRPGRELRLTPADPARRWRRVTLETAAGPRRLPADPELNRYACYFDTRNALIPAYEYPELLEWEEDDQGNARTLILHWPRRSSAPAFPLIWA